MAILIEILNNSVQIASQFCSIFLSILFELLKNTSSVIIQKTNYCFAIPYLLQRNSLSFYLLLIYYCSIPKALYFLLPLIIRILPLLICLRLTDTGALISVMPVVSDSENVKLILAPTKFTASMV